jgi:hypothetical protein
VVIGCIELLRLLDPRTYKIMNIEDKQNAIKEIQNLCTLYERTSEKDRSLLSNSRSRSGGNSRAAPAPPSQMMEDEQIVSLAFGGNTFETMSSLVPIQEEIRQYLPVMNTASSERDLPLPFWTNHAT